MKDLGIHAAVHVGLQPELRAQRRNFGAAVALVHYVPVQSSGSWCREVELCDCFVRNSKMEAPQAAALALTAKHYRQNLRRRRKGPFQS